MLIDKILFLAQFVIQNQLFAKQNNFADSPS
jgi:hypothetical protein